MSDAAMNALRTFDARRAYGASAIGLRRSLVPAFHTQSTQLDLLFLETGQRILRA